MSDNPFYGLLTASTSSTQPLNEETTRKLKECDDIDRYSECGWFCATGWKNNRVHVAVHARSFAEIDRALGLEKPFDDYPQSKKAIRKKR